jgi:putative restriction endonuclease
MGITPDFELRIHGALLDEVDDPMLRYGLQDMHGKSLVLPARVKDQPSRDGLALRWEKFAA